MSVGILPASVLPGHSRVRVLHVLEATLGGTRAYLSSVIDALDPREFECAIVYSTLRADSGWPEVQAKATSAGWQLFELDMRRAVDPSNDLRHVRALRRILRAFSPDIIHGHSSKGGAVARLAALGTGASVVYSPHSLAINLGRRYLLIEWLLSRITDGFIAVSSSERLELIREKLASSESIHVVHPVIEMERAGNSEPETGVEKPLVVSVGRLVPQKEPFAFVDLIRLLRKRGYNVRGRWVGNGELREAFEARIAHYGMDAHIEITGWVNNPGFYISRASVVASTAAYESFGIVIAEALALGVPVIAPFITGPIDILTGPLSAWLYPAGDIQRAAALIATILDNRDEARRMADQGRQMVANKYSLAAMKKALKAAYAAIWSAKKNGQDRSHLATPVRTES